MTLHRRMFVSLPLAMAFGSTARAQSLTSTSIAPADLVRFVREAERMRRDAVAAGDQSYGAVVVKGGEIVGWGPSRVVQDRNPDAHAERVAIWDAQQRLGTLDLSGAVLISTSHPCGLCERAAARARVARMYYGSSGADGGVPRPR